MSDYRRNACRGVRNAGDQRSLVLAGGGTDMDFSVIFDALSVERRRLVLYYLKDHDPADVASVAEQVAAWEQGVPPDELDPEDREQVRLDLSHCHLPKLADAGIVEYDRRTGELRYREPPAFLADLLERTADVELSVD